MVPAVTFAVGLFLGAVVTGAVQGPDAEQQVGPAAAEPTATSSPSVPAPATPGADVAVAVPRSCLEVAGTADELTSLVRDAAAAAGQLDAARLSTIVRQLEQSQASLDALSGECRTGTDPLP